MVSGENTGKEDGYESGDEFDTNKLLSDPKDEVDEGNYVDGSAAAQTFLIGCPGKHCA